MNMLDEKEQLFVDYWKTRREKESQLVYQALTGLPIGMLCAAPIVLLLFSARFWYKRADMAANTELNVWVLVAGLLGIAVFVGVFYKRYQWERREQQYLELEAREKKIF